MLRQKAQRDFLVKNQFVRTWARISRDWAVWRPSLMRVFLCGSHCIARVKMGAAVVLSCISEWRLVLFVPLCGMFPGNSSLMNCYVELLLLSTAKSCPLSSTNGNERRKKKSLPSLSDSPNCWPYQRQQETPAGWIWEWLGGWNFTLLVTWWRLLGAKIQSLHLNLSSAR